MDGLIQITNTKHLTKSVNLSKSPEAFLLDNFFKRKEYSKRHVVVAEYLNYKTNLAKFDARLGNGHQVGNQGSTTKQFTIPTSREFKVFDIEQIEAMTVKGSAYDDPASLINQVNGKIKQEIASLKSRVVARKELMAAQAMTTGIITVTINGGVTDTINMGFVTNVNKKQLTGDDRWTGTPDLINQLRAHIKVITANSGKKPTHLILGGTAAEKFLANSAVKTALDTNNYRVGAIDLTAQTTRTANYLGTILGVQVWEYLQVYLDDNDAEQLYIPANMAILVSPNDNMVDFYAPATRLGNDGIPVYKSGEMFLESKILEGNRGVKWELEQSSTPMLLEPSSIYSVTVTGDS